MIILKPGTYSDNLRINTHDLEIRSESGNPDDTIIKAKNTNNHVLTLQANDLKISGLELTGANGYAGICLSACNNCTIENNRVLSNGYGIYLLNSQGNILSNNKVTKNGEYGILFSTAKSNILSGNTVSNNNGRGIHIGTSDGNTLSGNTISSNGIYGLFVCPRSDDNRVFNNYFNNNVNAEIENEQETPIIMKKPKARILLAALIWQETFGQNLMERVFQKQQLTLMEMV
ncbi:MAG TPA: NosD domain-containing protein [Methanosarcina sp.]|nr:NosD domain-containing protein [Methanosarcina sp.]